MARANITFSVAFDEMSIKKYYREHARQMPFALSKALNDVAFMIKDDWGEHAKRVFDNPVRMTTNPGLVYNKASKSKLRVIVGLKDFIAKGTAPKKYLYAQVYGGPRVSKRSENALRIIGAMEPTDFIVPVMNSNVKILDSHGNIKRGLMTQILSDLRAFTSAGADQNRAVGKSAQYFSVRYKGQVGNFSPGIYKKMGRARPEKIIHFVRQPTYSKRFFYFEVAEKRVRKSMNERFAHHFMLASKIINRQSMQRAAEFRRERLALIKNTARLR